MKDEFQRFYDLLVIDRKFSAYSRASTLRDRVKNLAEEVDEIDKAIANNDMANLREELGDTMWDLISLMIIAEEQGLFTSKDVMTDAMHKLKRRKPWILTGEQLSVEEELARFKAVKQQEKGRS
ncbi:MAG: MazG nucleotide pyrophosphohydrolase domain-containing protein [Nanoarchaeota archaeon]